jgi:adhesin transport system membrane fusion protein
MADASERVFDGMGRTAKGLSAAGRPVFGSLLARVGVPERGEDLDWAGDADWARLQQDPLRARLLLRVAALVVVALIVWAAFAPVDEVTRGEAKVIPSSQVQIVQSVDGGVVEEIAVREGDAVEPGQLLMRIDPTRFVSSLRENRAEALALQAKAARLLALTQGSELAFGAELETALPEIVAHERRLYQSSREGVDAQLSIARDQLSQRQQELNEVRARREQAGRAFDLAQQELDVTRPLIKSGAVSEVDLLRLERDVARLRGERDQSSAQISRVQAAIAESTRKIEEVDLTVRNQWRRELSEAMSRLGSLSAGSDALADRVRHAEVRSGLRGTVKRVLVNTVGGVVQPGRELVEIVPLDDALILEARVKPQDIAFLRPGQDAVVKFTAYDFAIYGGLDAQVEHISADSIIDDKGDAHYLVRVRTHASSLGDDLPIIPGMMAHVDVLTGKKTVLAYLLKPILRARANALTER